MKISLEFAEEFISALDAVEFSTIKYLVRERAEREEAARTTKIEALKADFSFTPTEIRFLSQRANIEVIKSIRHRLDLGLAEAKRLFDEMRGTVNVEVQS